MAREAGYRTCSASVNGSADAEVLTGPPTHLRFNASVAVYLFDLDGTLVLTGGAGKRALDRAFLREYGIPEAMENVSPAGMTDQTIVCEALRVHLGRGPRDGEVARALALYLSYLPEELARSTAFRILAGVPSVIDALLADGHEVGLATGNLRDGARLKLEHAGVWDRFAFGGFADDSHDRPTLVRIAATRAARPAAPPQTFVVGDTPRDVAAAHAAGFVAIGVATGPYGADSLRDAGADRVIETLETLR